MVQYALYFAGNLLWLQHSTLGLKVAKLDSVGTPELFFVILAFDRVTVFELEVQFLRLSEVEDHLSVRHSQFELSLQDFVVCDVEHLALAMRNFLIVQFTEILKSFWKVDQTFK